jgi:hypothetical protein
MLLVGSTSSMQGPIRERHRIGRQERVVSASIIGPSASPRARQKKHASTGTGVGYGVCLTRGAFHCPEG